MTYNFTSITARPIRLDMIIVIMSVSAFIINVILYVFNGLIYSECEWPLAFKMCKY